MATHSVASVGTKEYDELLRFLREKREAMPISQESLSKKLGRARTYIEKIETGKRRVDIIEVIAIASALECDPRQFMGEICDRLKTSNPSGKIY